MRLEASGYEVVTASSGPEALNVLNSNTNGLGAHRPVYGRNGRHGAF